MKPGARLCPWLSDTLRALEQAAAKERLGHAFILAGPDGVGKRNLAFVLADRLLHGRTDQPEVAAPADVIAEYQLLTDGLDLHPDLHRVLPETGKQTIAVDQIRAMTSDLGLKAHGGGRKLVIIERAETMTTAAANALLKSLEEPTPGTLMLLLAERPGRLPPTVRSRCQRIVLRPPAAAAIEQWLGGSGAALGSDPASGGTRAPIALASLVLDDDKISKYNAIQKDINLIFDAKGDPHATADDWLKGELALALGSLAARIQLEIRHGVIGRHSNPVTDAGRELADNQLQDRPIESLFRRLKMTENLRDQLGHGVNVEIALKSLLVGLDTDARQREMM